MNEPVTLTVNGAKHVVTAPPTTPLLDVLRNYLGLTGSRYGCGLEQCGACTVLIDGQPSYSCSREIGALTSHAITTVESSMNRRDNAAIAYRAY
jgi:nicotinate dehydrogenase subunit A